MRFFERHDSWAAFVGAAQDIGERRPDARGWRQPPQNRDDGWYGTHTWEEALTLAAEGWDEPRPEIERIIEDIKDEVRPLLADTFRSDFDVAGAGVDIARFLEGEPECMVQLTPVKIAQPGRVISVLMNTGARAGVTPATIRLRGAAVCALLELLELLQHSTELWVETTAKREGEGTATILVKVKAAEDKLDIGKLCFALCNPAMHRRLCFARREALGFAQGLTQGGSIGLTQQEAVQANVVLDLVLRREVQAPAAWVRERLVEFGLISTPS